jgi:hypothetical protein
MTMGTQVGYDPGNFYVWRATDSFAIHLSLTVISQLTSQISRNVAESHPGEIRGVLLGRSVDTPSRATMIEDFALVPPSEDGANDDALFDMARRMAEGAGSDRRVVGYFRVKRDGTLNMGPRDLETFSRLFCETGNIALLIQGAPHGESEAGLFYWQHGGPHPRDFGFGFPFDAGQLATGHPGWRYPDPLNYTQPVSTPPSPTRRVPKQAPPPPPVRAYQEGIRWGRLLPTAALVAIGIAAMQVVLNDRTVAAAPASTQATATETAPLGLKVTSRPHQLEIRWNRQSPAITSAERGEMKITEGGTTQPIPFDKRQLQDGYVAYTPTTSDVGIRFEVTGKDGSATEESIRSVAIP